MSTQHRTPVENRTATPDEAGWRCVVQPRATTTHRPSLSWRLRH